MKENTSIKDMLELEMSRLKKAIDYIEQAEKSVRDIQEVNLEYKTRQEDLLKLNSESLGNFKSLIDGLELQNNQNKHTDNLGVTSNSVDALNDAIKQQYDMIVELQTALEKNDKRVSALEGEIENYKKMKWYKRIFG